MGCLKAIYFTVVIVVAAALAQIEGVGGILAVVFLGAAIGFYVVLRNTKVPPPTQPREPGVSLPRASARPATAVPAYTPQPPTTAPVEPWGRPTVPIEVVGEAYRPDSFRRLLPRHEIQAEGGASTAHPAALVPDPANPFDPKAVAVWVDGQHVGYLDRATAAVWHPVTAQLAQAGTHLQVPARTWAAQRGARIYARVTIKVPGPGEVAPRNALPSAPHVVLPTGGPIQVVGEELYMDTLRPWAVGDGTPVAVTLHGVYEVRPRSVYETVEVRIDDQRVGVLSPVQAANMLPLVKHVEACNLVPVARATVKGNALKADVVLRVAKAQEVDADWLAGLGPASADAPRSRRPAYEWDD